ncbi:MAG: hypothetical protein OEZ02_13160, partial [Anaerolineae bacterium]|nr:hypothetical protein [Anaerolineae bacterium]
GMILMGMAAYLALIVLLGTITRSTLFSFAMAFLGYLLELLISDVLYIRPAELIKPFLLYHNVGQLVVPPEGIHTPLFEWGAVCVVVVYGMLFLAGAILVFGRQNIQE